MNLVWYCIGADIIPKPRTCGDEPLLYQSQTKIPHKTPHMRG